MMTLEPINIATVSDLGGTILYVELRQGNSCIRLSLESSNTHKANYKWHEIRDAINLLAERQIRNANEAIGAR